MGMPSIRFASIAVIAMMLMGIVCWLTAARTEHHDPASARIGRAAEISSSRKRAIAGALAVAAFTALAAGSSFAAQSSTSIGEASMQQGRAHRVESSLTRASVQQAAVMQTGTTSVGEGSGWKAQGVMQLESTRDRADVRQAAIQAERTGRIQSGEASFM